MDGRGPGRRQMIVPGRLLFLVSLIPVTGRSLLYLVWSMTVLRWDMLFPDGHGSQTAVLDRPRTVS